MKGGVIPLRGPDGGMGKAFGDSVNYDSSLSNVYSPTPAGQLEMRHNKQTSHNQN